MTVQELEQWLSAARATGATGETPVRVVLRTGSVKEIGEARPFYRVTGGPALVLK